jgi:hypothetical protein
MNDKTTPKKGMSRIRDLDFFGIWVLERGIKKWFLTTRWITLIYGIFFSFGCGTGCCYD